MSSIRVSGNTSGHYDLTVPDVAGSNTIALDKIVVADSSGNVGIGTTQPDLKLHVDGTNGYPASSGTTPVGHIAIRAKNESSTHGATIGVADAAPWGTWIQAQDAGNLATEYPLLLNPNGGNVGIGTNSPTAILNVKSSSYPYVRVTNDGYTGLDIGQADSSEGGAALIKLRDAADMDFYTADLNRMRISSTGNVGIGTNTTDPTAKLHVNGNTKIGNYSSGPATGTAVINSVLNVYASTNLGQSAGDELKLLSLSGHSGNQSALTFRQRRNANGNNFFTDCFTIAQDVDNSEKTYEYMAFSDGNVGIGTDTPAEKLDLHGHIKMTNSYLKVRRNATYDQAWDIGITHANASQHGSLFIYPPSSQTIQSTSGVVMGTGNTGSNYPFILNGDGILTMDHQPSANVYIQSSNLGAYNNASSNSVIVATGIRHNIGGHYNTSNGRFTCPTSGRYFVSFSSNWYNNNAGTWIRPQIRRNSATHTQHYENTASNPPWMHISASTVIDCSAGDYLEIYNNTQSGAGGGMDVNQYSNINFHKIA